MLSMADRANSCCTPGVCTTLTPVQLMLKAASSACSELRPPEQPGLLSCTGLLVLAEVKFEMHFKRVQLEARRLEPTA